MIKIKLSDIVQPGRPTDVGQLERAIVAACNAEKEKEKERRREKCNIS